MIVPSRITIFLLAAALLATPSVSSGDEDGGEAPRTLIISFDGVGYDVVLRARDRGAFAGWPRAVPLISTFPSMTNIAFTAIYLPLGLDPIAGYEMSYYDFELNKVHGGGPVKYSKRSYPWRDYYQVMDRTNVEKAGYYFKPWSKARSKMQKVENLVFGSDLELMLAHFGSTDVTAHMRGNLIVEDMLVELSANIDALQHRHIEGYGRPLRIVMFSDHGNAGGKVRFEPGIKDALTDAGLRVSKQLEGPDDVVAPTYGAVGYGALFSRDENAEKIARAVAGHPRIDLAAWLAGEREVRVVSRGGVARIRWRGDADGGREFAYEMIDGDPLVLARTVARLGEDGSVDARGFISEETWLRSTAFAKYPDGPRRLVDSLTGTYVENAATVIFSVESGYCWGLPSVRLGAHLFGGRMEATHGGLDRGASHGFFLTNDPASVPEIAVRADHALDSVAGLTSAGRAAAGRIRDVQVAEQPCCGGAGSPGGAGHTHDGRRVRVIPVRTDDDSTPGNRVD
jgi:hypothetical protein